MKGWRVLVPRPAENELCALLAERGAVPLPIPLIRIRFPGPGGALDEVAGRLSDFDWIVVTSANGVRALFGRMKALGIVPAAAIRWAAVGPATAAALENRGVGVDRIPDAHVSTAIADELGELEGRRVLLPRAGMATRELPEALAARGARVDEVVAYDTELGPESSREPLARALDRGLDAAIFTSGSTIAGFVRLAGDVRTRLAGVETVCIGPTTARELEREGVRPSAVARGRTPSDLMEALEEVVHARA